MDARLQPIREKLDQQGGELEYIRSQLEAQGARIARLEKAISGPINDDVARYQDPAYNRKADRTVIKLNSPHFVTKDAVKESVGAEWLPEGDWEIVGDNRPRKFHTLQFTGLANIAAQRCQDALSRYFQKDNRVQLTATSPSGQVCDLYASPDKNAQQIRIEMLGRKLRRFIPTLPKCQEKKIFFATKQGFLIVDDVRIGQVLAPVQEDDPIIQWKIPLADRAGIKQEHRDLIKEHLCADLSNAGHDDIPWSL